MKKDEHLELVRKYLFYAVDLNLFLDTHPDCPEANEDYNLIYSKLHEALVTYTKEHGPLINFGLTSICEKEKWVESPWPWEHKCCKKEDK